VKVATRDTIAAAVLLVLAAVVIHQAGTLPFGTIRNPGEGFFPWWLGVALAGLALVLLGQTLRGRGTAETANDRLGRVVALLAGLGLYSLVLDPLGYPISTFLLVLFALAPRGRREFLRLAVVAALTAGGSYLLFGVWLQVPLPAGPLAR
jgi:putative tricarboxylic transport membrane protein